MHSLPHYGRPAPEWHTDKPTLTHYNHLKSIVYIRAHFWCYIFSEFGQMMTTCIRHYNITLNSVSAPKSCVLPM